MEPATCLELALEGERLCKAGDCKSGVAFFEAAIQAGTDDLKTLSAVYSQLGNAYFYLGDYVKAMQYHKHDLTLARTLGDRLGEAKASGNLGNTLKVMGKFEEAILCCEKHLEISRELGDRIGEGRALYNLGNVYHAWGKSLGRIGQKDPGDFPQEVQKCLHRAVDFYKQNLNLMTELDDRAAQGRACGNLGNTHYLLGNFTEAIAFHEERLKIAREFGDKSAERRAHSNLGNAHVFLGEFEQAADHYLRTLALAQDLGDRAVEAQACYSLGNTYTLLRDYAKAIEYHMRHLRIAKDLADKVGEGRACWSLGNAHAATGQHQEALGYARRHLQISKEIGDEGGLATAQMSVSELEKALGLPSSREEEFAQNVRRRKSMEEMDLLKLTPDVRQTKKEVQLSEDDLSSVRAQLDESPLTHAHQSEAKKRPGYLNEQEETPDEEDFFEMLTQIQSNRMDDQRCELFLTAQQRREAAEEASREHAIASNKEELMDLIAGIQGRRLDEQRAYLPGLTASPAMLKRLREYRNGATTGGSSHLDRQHLPTTVVSPHSEAQFPDEEFFDQLMRCQGTRLEDQRSTLPSRTIQSAPTVPDEDFFSLILKLQSGRLDDQRSVLPGASSAPSTENSDDPHPPTPPSVRATTPPARH
ncbi:unnamed protein product [Cyprideis torosa]|uniref:Uncharacterized protein n=1 Tax=Cyprideis torosa TaxID=163714 RepID=A0A7R8ZSS8_9CRUS|nr:unnamed protein product [Cyprideis torosa]CAG0902400.1 unnamed protein product [Cyprideis torosa]